MHTALIGLVLDSRRTLLSTTMSDIPTLDAIPPLYLYGDLLRLWEGNDNPNPTPEQYRTAIRLLATMNKLSQSQLAHYEHQIERVGDQSPGRFLLTQVPVNITIQRYGGSSNPFGGSELGVGRTVRAECVVVGRVHRECTGLCLG